MLGQKRYTISLTDILTLPYLSKHVSPCGCEDTYKQHEILSTILYVPCTGCPWRMLPHDFPAWKTAYHSFRRWRMDGTWERLNAALVKAVREAQRHAPEPRGVVVESQSVKTTARGLTRLGWGQGGQRRADLWGNGAPSRCA